MSHITKVKTLLKDGVVLRRTLQKLGYRVGEGDSEWGPRHLKDTGNIEMLAGKNGLWIGFRRGKEDEPYEMLADWDGSRKARETVLAEIHQAYSQEKILDLARVRGYAVTKNRVNDKGQIEMALRKLG
ncbi:MAG: DUF1257 domain-containing protein [Desulfatiglandales bacterium]